MEKKSLGIILDGHRRYAKAHGLELSESYTRGAQKVREIIDWARGYGYTDLIAFAFSEDNWARDPGDNEKVMGIFREQMENITKREDLEDLKGVRVRVRGQIERFPEEVQDAIRQVEEATAHEKDFTLWLAVSYNGRSDIVRAAKQCVADGVDITRESLGDRLLFAEAGDLACVIRPGGDERVSGFLLWELEYAELYFVSPLFPEFSREDFDRCMGKLSNRRVNRGA